jgi:hypothetical protein
MLVLYVPFAWMASIWCGLTSIFWSAFSANLLAGCFALFWLNKLIIKKIDEPLLPSKVGMTSILSGLERGPKH